ncbi:uncharacterized protein LOC104884650 [Beta vulgaris subsp. vulgaris]|uniref:uncharacterized protein LOC104884650 n=1 Tax=Beta vulgaris subsp. vulgaris TaxID=3555 RepID=UPI00053F3AE9|nr:uncharacterized protein LOC104884650 [Beta vulgaris subsp. vulgaris]
MKRLRVDNDTHDDMDGLIYDTHRDMAERFSHNLEEVEGEVDAEAKKFYRLVEDGKQELFPGCKTNSKLSFLIRLYLLKCVHGMTNSAISDILDLLLELLPEAKLPKSFNEAKKLVKDLGLHYDKIHACRNDCMLYWKEHEAATSCHVCQASRWKENENQGDTSSESTKNLHKVPAKVVWHFPLKPRLQRLYMCSETAELMRWHEERKEKDGLLRHRADGEAWKEFDRQYLSFASESRNVRLGLASDGFNPFRTMSTQHSTWPVVLINYNLPPWLCMKSEFLMLSLLIPGPSSPGKDIDVYLQPLIEELKELWEYGLDTYDASKHQTFKMHAALQSTTSDFPGYAMLSGWSTKGKFVCPYCHYETDHRHLNNSNKSCYLAHRRGLNLNHPWRYDAKSFDGEKEERIYPDHLSGAEIQSLLENWENSFGKLQPKKNYKDCPWRKSSIFHTLPYWRDNGCPHHLDVMHIEKNICDNVLSTLLDVPGKSKDHHKARLDLEEMGVRQELHPKKSDDERYILLPKASFSMTKEEKSIFCSVLKKAKLPQGCASNIARCVQVKEGKLLGYKSHDAHIIMQHLLLVAIRKVLPKHVALPLIRLSAFFRTICSTAIDPTDLGHLQTEINETLCELERIFPPSFFDIMVHLPIHLVDEIKLGGPVYGWWMYPIERYLGKLKSYVKNRSRPEASIAEGDLAEECLIFCSRYLHDGAKKRRKVINRIHEEGGKVDEDSPLFPKIGYPLGRKIKGKKKGIAYNLDSNTRILAHRYALFNCEDKKVGKYIKEHEEFVKNNSREKRKRRWREAQQHSNEFMDWFRDRVELDEVIDHIKWLSLGPSTIARRYTGYFCNGYKFYSREHDEKCKTQNSGVSLTALTPSFASSKDRNTILGNVTYYGKIKEIIEIDYWSAFSVVLFRCDWFHVETDNYGMIRVNFKRLCSMDDPFVLASQGQCEDTYLSKVREPLEDLNLATVDDDDITWCRGDAFDRVEVHQKTKNNEPCIESHENNSDVDETDWDWMEPLN